MLPIFDLTPQMVLFDFDLLIDQIPEKKKKVKGHFLVKA